MSQVLKVLQVSFHGRGQAHPVGFAAGDASLEQAEEAFASQNAKGHALKLA